MLGEAIKRYRTQNNLTQQELAEIVQCSVDTVRRWEANSREPRSSEIKKLCEIFKCSETELLNGESKKEFEVKIIMGVNNLPITGLTLENNKFFLGVDEETPQITLGGKVGIETQEEREKSLKEIISRFWEACWMYDHRDEAKAAVSAQTALSNV